MECNVIHLPFCSPVEEAVISYASLAAGRGLYLFISDFVCVYERGSRHFHQAQS